MFSWLRNKLGRRGLASCRVPEKTRVYAIGDIHGRIDLLQQMHAMILRDALDFKSGRLVAVYLGDYVDRGLESRAVVDFLLDEPLSGFENVYLKGNHEQTLLSFLENSRVALDWLSYGGDATLYSYGVGISGPRTSEDTFIKARETFEANLPERHLHFYQNLDTRHVEGDYFFTHAGVRPGTLLPQQDEGDLLWIRDVFLDSDDNFGKIIVHGHSITMEPEVMENRIGIDTGAFVSGHLTCLVLEGTERRFLQT